MTQVDLPLIDHVVAIDQVVSLVAGDGRVDEALREALHQSLARCASVDELRTWVELELRPAYGRLKLVWVETLRRRYADRLAVLASGDGPAGVEA